MDRLISEQAVIDRLTHWYSDMLETSEEKEDLVDVIKAIPSAEPCGDAISRKSLKHKLQEHHDFFVDAYGGFSNLPLNDKSRVDEISNCIAMVVNEPSVNPQPKTGHWVKMPLIEAGQTYSHKCSLCGRRILATDVGLSEFPYCHCGAKMQAERSE